MKRLLLLFLSLFSISSIFAQAEFWNEDFNIPLEWTMEDNWSINDGKLFLNWNPAIIDFDLSATSPVISLNDSPGELIVTQYLDNFEDMYNNEMAEIIVIHDGIEDILWSYSLENDDWGSLGGEDISLEMSEYAGKDVQIKFHTFGGSTYNWNYWYIYNVKITTYLDIDLAIVGGVTGNSNAEIGETCQWSVEVKNAGLTPESNYTVKLYDYKTGLIGSIEEEEVLEVQATKSYTFSNTFEEAYNTILFGVVEFEDDQFLKNNTSTSYFVRIEPDIEYDILVIDKDNGILTINCPEKGDKIDASIGIERILTSAGLDFDVMTNLPNNLNDYEIVYYTMGNNCVS